MKRIRNVILSILVVCITSGCFLLENENLMVCEYQPLKDYLDYEVYYSDDEITKVKIITVMNYKDLSKKELEEKKDDWKKIIKSYNEEDGIDAEIQVDLAIITTTVQVNIDKYDAIKDPLQVFNLTFEEKDFESVESFRKKVQDNYFKCDQLVEN
ncbi:uncharacterized lipoprotein YehR (DUF1307 family) [Breznakia sp. PF5-3]|uniref:hypothetical protein n=1 Tax=unclassified Breznakia TaxID=2623764 RepID=UPI002406600E|nr:MULTISPECIES: hypothetical protein [unclassified Breznakia]MDF9824853.1 uncharacterized lipoprotein YehR (DUF1307 family) [Breznakia sp. PM6-1]MDF9835710.1 uncharacterized lipoprotein YehR (DUF1307 family) [Breznakia sp. PF5-3]MDF9838270.1 uncharacterized lipoprotein YehR (DUF1307 family) [Breznakia sp. PFB2-8]MDF9860291.1 uncharacterized lipoprotein YehR (DUF1307 family) [Breznakia sp. PH5-24]